MAQKFGLECYDENGNQTLRIADTIARLIYTAQVSAGASSNISLPALTGKTSAEFGICLETNKHAHDVSRSGTTITWTARTDQRGVICAPSPITEGYPSGNTQIFVYVYD